MNRDALFAWLKRHGLTTGIILFLFGMMFWAFVWDLIQSAKVLTDTIRIDLDDLVGIDLVGVGTIIIGLAALRRAFRNGKHEAEDYTTLLHETEKLSERIRLLEQDE